MLAVIVFADHMRKPSCSVPGLPPVLLYPIIVLFRIFLLPSTILLLLKRASGNIGQALGSLNTFEPPVRTMFPHLAPLLFGLFCPPLTCSTFWIFWEQAVILCGLGYGHPLHLFQFRKYLKLSHPTTYVRLSDTKESWAFLSMGPDFFVQSKICELLSLSHGGIHLTTTEKCTRSYPTSLRILTEFRTKYWQNYPRLGSLGIWCHGHQVSSVGEQSLSPLMGVLS